MTGYAMDDAVKRPQAKATAAPAPRTDNVRLGMLLMLVAVFIAPLIDVFSKLAAATLPPAEVSAFRFVFQTALMLPLVLHFLFLLI